MCYVIMLNVFIYNINYTNINAECLFTLTPPSNVWLGESTHKKRQQFSISFSGEEGKACAF